MFFTHEIHDGEEMFELGGIRNGDPLEAVQGDVHTVQEEFGDCLRDEDMGREELDTLNLMLKAYAKGPRTDAAKVAREGAKLLEKVQARLKTAAADLQRFDEESFAGVVSTGRGVDRLTKAASAVRRARERLEEVL
jgi:hypothetical protein